MALHIAEALAAQRRVLCPFTVCFYIRVFLFAGE